MYIKNNRLYDNGVSFEIPEGARININPNGSVAMFKDDEPWYIAVDIWGGQFGEKELKEYISDLFENNHIAELRTDEKTVNGVPTRQVCYASVGFLHEPSCTFFLNCHLEFDKFWQYCQVWCSVYDSDLSYSKNIEDYPAISAFINSIRKEPFEKWREAPVCVIEMREARNKASI